MVDEQNQSTWRTSISCLPTHLITRTVRALTDGDPATYSLCPAHTQPHVYPFYSSPTHHQPPPPDPSRQSSPAPSSIPTTSSHGLFLQQSTVPDSSSTQEQHAEPPVDQIQDDPPIDEEPLYVNAKQYYRILKRRVARARLEEVHRLSRQRKVCTISVSLHPVV